MRLLAATRDGISVLRRITAGQSGEEAWEQETLALQGTEITSVVAREGVALAGSRNGILRSDDGGATWQSADDGMDIKYVRWLAYHPQLSDYEFAGTEPAAIFYSVDGARSWQACPEVEEMRDRFGWRLPYSPRAGCVRGFAFHGGRAYAAVEDGAVLRSDDVGASWQLAPGSAGNPLHNPGLGQVHSDVHSIEVHPSSADLVVAPTGGGLFSSGDGGVTWTNLYRCYCRAVWLDAQDANHMVFGPASGVDRQGRIEESRDGGDTWEPIHEGIDAPWSQHMVERLIASGETLFAVLSNGDLLASRINHWHWRRVLPGTAGVNDLAVIGNRD